MKGKKPTREQRKILIKNRIDSYSWMIQKDTPEKMQIVNKETGEVMIIEKR